MVTTLLTLLVSASMAEPNPPSWPASVRIFYPNDTDIDSTMATAYNENGGHIPANHGQFSSARFAFLFTPGEYDVDAPVGYYTQVLGLGESPEDVVFTSARGVYSREQDWSKDGALSTFWRSAENFKTKANYKWNVGTGMMWAVSQAAPLRRVMVENDLCFFEYEPPIGPAGMSSGGYMANVEVNGTAKPGSQQQWFGRDSTVANWVGGVWNMVFTGVDGAPATHCGNTNSTPSTNVPTTPIISEKPYITINSTTGKYFLQIPPLKTGSRGSEFDTERTRKVDFARVYVTKLTDDAKTINEKLAKGLHIIFSAGIYKINTPLLVNHHNQVLLGLGLATLVASEQTPSIIEVGDVDGVRLCGLLLQAGTPAENGTFAPGSTLISWGSGQGSGYAGNSRNPGFLHDIFMRVGGPDGSKDSPVAVETMLHVRNGHVIGDNLWLWRADHAQDGVPTYTSNRNDHGLIVDGDDVTMYGLAVEHSEADLTTWNGNRGRTYFYQSELPYGVNQSEFTDSVSYRVTANVSEHHGWGLGVYCNFVHYPVNVTSGIVAPKSSGAQNDSIVFVNPLTVFLNGYGGIEHIVNDQGDASVEGVKPQVHYLCN